jgi:hypothetical protein
MDQQHHGMSGILRRSTTQSIGPHRASISSQDTHRNRFLSRLGRPRGSSDLPRESLAEQGQAVRMGSNEAFPSMRT